MWVLVWSDHLKWFISTESLKEITCDIILHLLTTNPSCLHSSFLHTPIISTRFSQPAPQKCTTWSSTISQKLTCGHKMTENYFFQLTESEIHSPFIKVKCIPTDLAQQTPHTETYLDQMVSGACVLFSYTNQWDRCLVIQNPQTETLTVHQRTAAAFGPWCLLWWLREWSVAVPSLLLPVSCQAWIYGPLFSGWECIIALFWNNDNHLQGTSSNLVGKT